MKKVMIVLRNTVLRLMLTVMVMTASVNVCAQKASQTLRGTVRDAINHEPVAYATIILTDNPLLKAISDSVGRFSIGDVPVGRHNLRCQYVGYETVEMNELLVTSAKETYVDILLSEAVKELGNLVIRPKVTKEKALNRMVLTGGRMFSVEETSRYAAASTTPLVLPRPSPEWHQEVLPMVSPFMAMPRICWHGTLKTWRYPILITSQISPSWAEASSRRFRPCASATPTRRVATIPCPLALPSALASAPLATLLNISSP